MLDRSEWTKGDLLEDGAMCVLGAISAATAGHIRDYREFESAEYTRAKAVAETLGRHIPLDQVGERREDWTRVYEFNDLPDVTKRDVLNLFDKALAELGGLG